MKLKLAAPALVLVLAANAGFAQGIEGHQVGYSDKAPSEVAYSTRNAPRTTAVEHREIFVEGHAHAEDYSNVEVTVYPTLPQDLDDGPLSR